MSFVDQPLIALAVTPSPPPPPLPPPPPAAEGLGWVRKIPRPLLPPPPVPPPPPSAAAAAVAVVAPAAAAAAAEAVLGRCSPRKRGAFRSTSSVPSTSDCESTDHSSEVLLSSSRIWVHRQKRPCEWAVVCAWWGWMGGGGFPGRSRICEFICVWKGEDERGDGLWVVGALNDQQHGRRYVKTWECDVCVWGGGCSSTHK